MKQLIICMILSMVFLIYIGKTTIEFKPFKVSIERPFLIVSIVLMSLAFVFMHIDATRQVKKEIIKKIQEIKDDKQEKWENRDNEPIIS